MKININGQEIEVTSETMAKLNEALFGNNGKQLSEVAIGDTFKVADIEFIKLSEENGTVQAVTKDILFNAKFDDDSNNFADSSLLKRLVKEILPKIEAAIGKENVLEFETDLTSLDGLDDYGTMRSKISLPTFDCYRKHVKIFDKYKANSWWWLSTADSTPTHDYRYTVRCVYYDGALCCVSCHYDDGVRPFCVFNSEIFVS